VHSVSVTLDGAGGLRVVLHSAEHGVLAPRPSQEEATTEPDEGPSPIAPEGKELLWGGGAFVVFLVVMRLWLVPAVKKGMRDRYGMIRSDFESADATLAAAREELAEYEGQLAAVRGEAAGRVDAVRHQLDGERADRISEANAAIAERRSAAATEAEAAKLAARASIEEAVASIAARAVELSTGRRPDETTLRSAVAEVTGAGVR
jgi:F-type H+-transporting ATPase subunit b